MGSNLAVVLVTGILRAEFGQAKNVFGSLFASMCPNGNRAGVKANSCASSGRNRISTLDRHDRAARDGRDDRVAGRRSRRRTPTAIPGPTTPHQRYSRLWPHEPVGATWRIMASSLAKSMGLVRWAVKPASRLRRMSSSIP